MSIGLEVMNPNVLLKNDKHLNAVKEVIAKHRMSKRIEKIPDVYGMALYIVKFDKEKESAEIVANFDFKHPNQLRILRDSSMWTGVKKMELRNDGINIEDCLLIATHIEGLKRPNWLFDRIAKHGVKVL
jgi:hypothetical protein